MAENTPACNKAQNRRLPADRRAMVEVLTLYWSGPISFMLFIGLGGTLVGLGIIVYLIAIVAA